MARTDDPQPRIEALRRFGMADEAIFTRLLMEGWSAAALEEKLDLLELPEGHRSPARALAPVRETPALPRQHAPAALIVAVVVAVAATGFAAFTMLRPPVVYSISIPQAQNASSTIASLTYGALPALSDANYYGKVKDSFVIANSSFIDANLSTMSLTVYQDGQRVLTVPILAKGKVGSWWETPAGIYKIETKERDHFSSIGEVHMPYSMEFQGNFFIHGWPYYDDGMQVATSYSGGCIRLSTDDAQRVFDVVKVGVPVIVYNDPPPSDQFNYSLKAPPINANAYLIADMKNGTVLASKNPDVAAPIASVTKLITALVATEYINLEKHITVPDDAIVYTTIPRLKPGQNIRAYDLLYLLLQESSNEAAETLASAVGRDAFVKHMNEKAQAIGLKHTVFSDPSGAKGDYSTPEDLFTLLHYIYDNRRFVLGITAGQLKDTAYGDVEFKNVRNFNMVAGAALVGGKIGQTREALDTYAGIFSIPIGDQDRDIAIIVLGSQQSLTDTKKLHDFIARNYAPGQ